LKEHLGITSNDIFISKNLVLSSGNLAAQGDVVLINALNKWDAAQILVNFSFSQCAFALADQLSLLTYDPCLGNANWTEHAGICILPAKDILCSVTYTRTRAGLMTLVPCHLR
jgi:hypothetical protein